MHLTTALSLALSTAAMASASGSCFALYHADISSESSCGDRTALSSCLSSIVVAAPDADSPAIEACYTQAGCSPSSAASEASYALSRCTELQTLDDLRRRHRSILDTRGPAPTPAPKLLRSRENLQGDACFDFSLVQTTVCPVQTNAGKVTTLSCVNTEITSSSCKAAFTCTVDNGGADVCMKVVNQLDTGGIIIAIIFSAAIVLGIGLLTFMGCKESRQQKRLAARAEASALARAATRKQRAQDRVPLMRQQDAPVQGGMAADPFHDGQRVS
jgi:hypothetical protein